MPRRPTGLIVWAVLLLACASQAGEKKVLTGHRPAAAERLKPVGEIPAETRLNLAISLPLRNRTALKELLKELYDPASPNFHHFLTPLEFTEKFAPTRQDYQSVVDFARRQNLIVSRTHPNRLLLDVTGSARDIERAFNVKLCNYRQPSEPRQFFAPDREPSVDASLPVLQICGLNSYLAPHVNLLPSAPKATPSSGSGPSGTYLGGDFRAAYAPGVTLDGSGQSVGLFELDGYYNKDITNYETSASLPVVPLTNVLVDGYSGTPDTNVNFIAEVSLDIEMAISMAPHLNSVLVYEASNQNLTIGTINDVLNKMATDDLANQLSSSWSWGGDTNSTGDQIFIQMALQGQSFFQASGDSGEYHGSREEPPEPVDDPYITIVGGTTLTTTGPGGSWVSEKVWNWALVGEGSYASSGGVSAIYKIPSWQQGIGMKANEGSTTMRNLPDVALTADNIYVAYDNGQTGDFGGTSCATPLWAAFTALINQHTAAHNQSTVGFINSAVYSIGKGATYTADFHDITNGNNNLSGGTIYPAVTNYDLCTGWGTPNGSNMIVALGGSFARITPTITWSAPASINYGQALGVSQLNAAANVPGAFAYTPSSGTILGVGTHMLTVVFTPANTFDYNSATDTISLIVSPVTLNVTANNASRVYGAPNPAFSVSYSGFVNDDTTNVLSGSPSLMTSANATSTVAGSPYPIVAAVGTLSAANYTFNFNNGELTITAASSSAALMSSLNPQVAGSNLTFTAIVSAVSPASGTPTGSVQFNADSIALGSPVILTDGVATVTTSSLAPGAHAITAQYAGDGNFLASAGTLAPNQVVNSPPLANNLILSRTPFSEAKISINSVLTQDSSANSGALSLVSTASASTNGGLVVVTNNWIFYTPISGFTNADAFSYTIADSEGVQAAGAMSIVVPVDTTQSQNIVALAALPNNGSIVQFQGIPGRAYTIQYTPSLQSPSWETVGGATANTTGGFVFTNTPPAGQPAGFYRSTYP